MRSSAGTNFELPCSVVARTKSRIACFAAPSFQEASGALGVVCALIGEEGSVVDRNGNKMRFKARVRRVIPGDRSSDFIAVLAIMSVSTTNLRVMWRGDGNYA